MWLDKKHVADKVWRVAVCPGCGYKFHVLTWLIDGITYRETKEAHEQNRIKR